jgi:hypothetical protein
MDEMPLFYAHGSQFKLILYGLCFVKSYEQEGMLNSNPKSLRPTIFMPHPPLSLYHITLLWIHGSNKKCLMNEMPVYSIMPKVLVGWISPHCYHISNKQCLMDQISVLTSWLLFVKIWKDIVLNAKLKPKFIRSTIFMLMHALTLSLYHIVVHINRVIIFSVLDFLGSGFWKKEFPRTLATRFF